MLGFSAMAVGCASEPFVRDQVSAHDRVPVRVPAARARLGSLDGCQLPSELLAKRLVELVVVEFRRKIAEMVVSGGQLAVVRVNPARKRLLDPFALWSFCARSLFPMSLAEREDVGLDAGRGR